MEKSTSVLFIVVLCILYIKWFYVFCIRYLKFHKGTIVFSYVSYIKRLYIFCTRIPQGYCVLCLSYKMALCILYPQISQKGTIIILCILIRGFRCILYPKFHKGTSLSYVSYEALCILYLFVPKIPQGYLLGI